MGQTNDELKASLKELSQRRAQIEQEIAVRTARLETAGVGMHGSLVDAEVSVPIFLHLRARRPQQ